MKLSFDQLNRFVIGCDSTEMADGAWRTHRLPDRLRPVYDTPPRFAVRRDCPSSVRLRFVTDSTQVSLSLRYAEAAHPVYQGAAIVDGAAGSIAFGPLEHWTLWQGIILAEPARVPRTIDLWLPHLCKVDVLAVELDDAAMIAPAPPPAIRWLAYGDSITQGFCATLPTRSLVGRCALALNAAVHNLGVGGSQLLAALADTIPVQKSDLISIAYGVCDFQENAPLESIQRNATRLIDSLKRLHPGCPIVVITPINFNAADRVNGLGLTLQHYRDALSIAAGRLHGVLVVDGERLVPNDPSRFDDWVHPNDAGFEVYARNLLPHLQRALKGQA